MNSGENCDSGVLKFEKKDSDKEDSDVGSEITSIQNEVISGLNMKSYLPIDKNFYGKFIVFRQLNGDLLISTGGDKPLEYHRDIAKVLNVSIDDIEGGGFVNIRQSLGKILFSGESFEFGGFDKEDVEKICKEFSCSLDISFK